MAHPDFHKTERVREAARRREMPVGTRLGRYGYQYTTFRPRVDIEPTYYAVRRWCDDPDVKTNFSSLLNSLMPGLKVALENTTEIDEDGNVTIELNLGRILIK